MWGDQPNLSALQALQRQADELARTLVAGQAAAAAEFVGGDEAGAVEVTIDAEGTPARVRLAADWHRVVGATGLGPAVLAALSAAATQRLAAWADGVASASASANSNGDASSNSSASSGNDKPPAPAAEVRSGTSSEPRGRHVEFGDPSAPEARRALRDLMDLLADVTDRAAELSAAASAAGTRPVAVTNAGRTVRVTATGGAVTEIEFEDRWLRSAQHERVAEAIREALVASARATAEARRDLTDDIPGFDRIRRLTESPETLLREIGLLR